MRDVSVPAFGSVTPNDMTISPVAIRGRYLRLSASEPCLITGIGGNREKWIGEAPEVPAPEAQTSWSMIVASVTPRPEPPYASGMIIPSQPAFPKAFTQSHGYSAFLSLSSQ